MFDPKVEQLAPIAAPIVESMLGRQWLHTVLAIIEHESGGIVGQKSGVQCGNHNFLPTKMGVPVLVKNAYGLMQTIPDVILDYSKDRKVTIFFDDVSGDTKEAAEKQIKIGCWLLKHLINRVSKYVTVTKQQKLYSNGVGFVVMAYGIGAGKVIPMLEDMKNDGIDLTLENAEIYKPNLGQPGNKPFSFARWVLKKSQSLLEFVWQETPTGAFLLVACVLTAYLLLK
jgi:hypothetical protein